MKWLVLLCLVVAGCASTPPVEKRTVVVDTLDGPKTYAEDTYLGRPIWTREDPREAYKKNPKGYRDRRELVNYESHSVSRILIELFNTSRLKPPETEQELWTRYRIIWEWCVVYLRPHPVSEAHRREKEFQGVTLHDHAKWWDRYAYLPEGNDESVANVFLQLLIQAGIPTDRIALAHCRYPSLASKNRAGSHAYTVLYINDAWHYFDPNARRWHRQLPHDVAEVESLGYHSYRGYEYTWPYALSFFEPDPLEGRLPFVRR